MKSGIYKFTSVLTGKTYIGLSQDIYYRKRKHLETLRDNRHHNNHLQSHFNKYGEKDLLFNIIEFCPVDQLEEKEIYWIKKLNTISNGFNQTEGGHLKDYISKLFSFENIKTGECIENITVKKFCEITNCDISAVYKIIKNKTNHTNNWKIKGKILIKRKYPVRTLGKKKIELINIKTNKIFYFPSQILASKELNIPQGSLSHLFRGKIKIYNDYILLINKDKLLIDKNQKIFTLVHPTYGKFVGYNQQEFCRKFNANAAEVCGLVNGKISQYKQWKLIK